MTYDPSNPDQAGGQPVPAGSQTPAGWYADPGDPTTQRYWDGVRWTENRAPGAATAVVPTNGKATASMVLGILGLLFLYVIGPILALVFGYQAKNEIEASNRAQGGRGMAIAGIVMGWVSLGITILFVLLWLAFGVIVFSVS